jgi:hypothetical protein
MVIRKIQNAQGNTSYPAVNLVKKDPKIAAMISKTIRSNTAVVSRDQEGNRKTLVPHSYAFKNSLQKRAKRNSDAATILKLLPDIELSIQILVSSILSPSDMMSMDINFVGPKNMVSSELMGSLLNRLKDYFNDDYKIKPLLPKMLREILAEKGAYPVAVIPENSIDQFINGDQAVSMEAFKEYVDNEGKPKNIGILGNYKVEEQKKSKIGLAFENFNTVSNPSIIDNCLHYYEKNVNGHSYVREDFLFVTDNPATLKLPMVNAKVKTKEIKKTFGKGNRSVSLESNDQILNDLQVEKLIYRNRNFGAEPVATLKKQNELERKSVGNPLIMKLPSEAIIPVHVPGNVESHIGYFVILDEEGNPIEAPDGDHYYAGMGAGMSSPTNGSLSSNIIRKVETNIGNNNSFNPSSAMHLDFAAQVYADMIERDLISRVKNGIHSNTVSLAKNDEVYRIMLSRVLAKKYTQILFLPIEYVTYFAFKYSDDGIGRSLLDDTSMINTLRTVLMFTDVIASVKNSIGRTRVTMTLPEGDPNPMKTIELAQDEIVRSRQLGIPLGVTNPADITDFIQRAGFEWQFEGHPGLPDLKFDVQNTNTNFAKPDTDLQDYLRKSSIMAMGLSPEMVDSGFNTEFATSVVANNVLLGKRVLQYQELFCPLLADHLRKVALNSESLIHELRDILTQNKDGIKLDVNELEQSYGTKFTDEIKDKLIVNKVLNDFLNQFEVQLPKPPSVTLSNQLDNLKVYTDALDTSIEAYISDTFLTSSTAGELSNEINTIKAMIKSHFTRKFLTDNGMMTELSELTATKEDGEPQLNLMKEITNHVEALVRSGVTTMIKLAPMVKAATADLAAANVQPGEDNSGGSDSGDSGSSDDFGGGDDFGMDDFGMDESSPEDTPLDPDAESDDTEEEKTDEEKKAEEEEKKKAEEEQAEAEKENGKLDLDTISDTDTEDKK